MSSGTIVDAFSPHSIVPIEMAPSIARKRSNRFAIALSYLTRAWRNKFAHSFHVLTTTSCSFCRRRSFASLFARRRKLRKARARRFPPQAIGTMKSSNVSARPASLPPVPGEKSSAVAPRAISEGPAESEAAKKRKISEDEPYGRRSRREPKKPRIEGSSDAKPQQEPQKKPNQQASSSSSDKRVPQKPGQEHTDQQASSSNSVKKPQQEQGQEQSSQQASSSNSSKNSKKLQEKPQQSQSDQHASPSSNKDPKPGLTSPKSPAPASVVSKAWPSRVGTQKITGLQNPSMWCYRRAVLQNLVAIPQLFNLLDRGHQQCKAKPGRCVTCALRRLFNTYQTGGAISKDLRSLDDAIAATGRTSDPRWTRFKHTQEDGHEFLQYLLGTVENARGMPEKQFKSLFQIAHTTSWTCSNCSKIHTKTDPSGMILDLPIVKQRGPPSLSSCLDAYHKETGTIIRCDKCKKNIARTRTLRIAKAPDILPITLKRFSFAVRGRMEKNTQAVDCPDTLDLSHWAADSSKPLQYRLQSIVAHSGSLNGGHYIAFVRGSDGVKECDDGQVSNATASALRKSVPGFTPYILVYTKV